MRARARAPRGGLGSRGAGRPLRSPGRANSGLLLGGDRPRRAVALLPDEPDGKIATRTAGAIEFRAMLVWRGEEDVPREPLFPELPLDAARCQVAETWEPLTRSLAGQIMALSLPELGSALEVVLRSVTVVAGLTEATLEVGAVRAVPPRVATARAVEELARDLWIAGFAVRFGPSWAPAPEADVYVGGGDGGLQGFLRAHPSWSMV